MYIYIYIYIYRSRFEFGGSRESWAGLSCSACRRRLRVVSEALRWPDILDCRIWYHIIVYYTRWHYINYIIENHMILHSVVATRLPGSLLWPYARLQDTISYYSILYYSTLYKLYYSLSYDLNSLAAGRLRGWTGFVLQPILWLLLPLLSLLLLLWLLVLVTTNCYYCYYYYYYYYFYYYYY